MSKQNNFPFSVRTRVSLDTFTKVQEAAEIAGLSLGRYVRYRLDNTKIPDQSKMKLLNELRRQGGLMKHLASEGHDTKDLYIEIKASLKKIEKEA